MYIKKFQTLLKPLDESFKDKTYVNKKFIFQFLRIIYGGWTVRLLPTMLCHL